MRFALLILFPLAAWCQPTNLRLISVTPQQAIIDYDAPSTAACTLALVSGGALVDTVYDVAISSSLRWLFKPLSDSERNWAHCRS